MSLRVEFLDGAVLADLEALPLDIRANFLRISRLIASEGLHRLREPYVKHLEGPVWEMRMKGRDGIARAAYVTASNQRVVVVHVFTKRPKRRLGARLRRPSEGQRRLIDPQIHSC